jgi:hypothetical protein
MAKSKSFFEKKSVVASFGILSLLGGVYFTRLFDTGNVTGNATGNSYSLTSFMIPLIGLLLLVCSIILISYSIVKKE